jgi:hypothetical protein
MIQQLRSLFNFFRPTANSAKKKEIDKAILQSIEKYKNRPIYTTLTTEIIDETSDDELSQVVVESLIIRFPPDYQKKYETLTSWTQPQQVIYLTWYLEAEVLNGGFNQYYFNSGGVFAKLTPDALTSIGANGFAELMQKANEIYGTNNDQITREHDGSIEGFSKSYIDNPLNALDDEFYHLSEIENITQLQTAYIRNNKNEFVDQTAG